MCGAGEFLRYNSAFKIILKFKLIKCTINPSIWSYNMAECLHTIVLNLDTEVCL
jgi:hypothetical protein